MGLDRDLVVVDRDLDAFEEGLIHLSPDGVFSSPVHLVTVASESGRRGQRRLDALVADISGGKPFVDCGQPGGDLVALVAQDFHRHRVGKMDFEQFPPPFFEPVTFTTEGGPGGLGIRHRLLEVGEHRRFELAAQALGDGEALVFQEHLLLRDIDGEGWLLAIVELSMSTAAPLDL